jgi:putative endonuclease
MRHPELVSGCIRHSVKMEKQPCMYIMVSKKHGYIYIGVTSNLPQRYYQHRHGLVEGFSKKRNTKLLIRFELFSSMDLAIAREKQLKNWHRDWKINLIEGDNPEWINLATGLGFES